MRTLYEYQVSKKEKIKNPETEEQEDVNNTYNFAIKKPTRSERNELMLYESAVIADCIKRGIMTRAILQKNYLEADGILTQVEKESYTENLKRSMSLRNEISLEFVKKKQDKEKIREMQEELSICIDELNRLQGIQEQAYTHTADSIARNKSIVWLVGNLLYKKVFADNQDEEGLWEKYCEGEDLDEILDFLDEKVEEGDDFDKKVVNTATLFLTVWNSGNLDESNMEEFNKYVEEL